MKVITYIFLLFTLLSGVYINAQSVVFHENFEIPSGADSLTSSPLNYWAVSSKLFASGSKADSCQVKLQDTTFLTTNTFSTLGMQYVILDFDQICKIEFFDAGYIEVSNNNGATWTTLTSSQYLGSGQFGTVGNRFNATSYSDWLPVNNNAIPTNLWWKHEIFDISSFAANTAQVKIRFTLVDLNNSGPAGNYGWLLDNVKIMAALDELILPTVNLNPPFPQDSVFSTGPFIITASVTDNSGIDSVLLIYNKNGGPNDTSIMVYNYGSIYSGVIDTFPAFSVGDTVCYHVWAMDSSLSQNTQTAPQGGCQSFVIYLPQPYPNCTTAVSTFPYYETFDLNFTAGGGTPSSPGSFAAGWERNPTGSSGFTWLVYTGSTPTSTTGPTTDHTSGNGNYVYTEASYGTTSNTTTLLTPCLNLNAINVPVLEFYYHMWGSSQGELHVDIWYGNSWQNDIIAPIIGDKGDLWHKVSVNIGNYKGAATKIRFRAIRGSSIYSDIAIDDVKIWEPPAYDAGMVRIDKPLSPANTGLQAVKATFSNFGSTTLTKVTINWQVNGVPKSPFIWTGILTPGAIADSIIIGTHNFISGPSNIKVWTSAPNDSVDGFSFNDTVQTSVIACTSPLRGTFTIGGPSADFLDFGQAIYAIENCGIDSAIVFLVNAGTYTEQLDIDTIPGASVQNNIKFVSSNGDSSSVILNFAPSNYLTPHVVRFVGASFISFSKITIASTSTSYGRLFVFEAGASHITVENCVLQMPPGSLYYTNAAYAVTSKSEYNSFINNDISNGYYAFYFSGMSTTNKSKGNRFIGNNIHGYQYYGAYLMYQDSFLIAQNTFKNDSASSSVYPIYAYYADGGYRIEKNNIVAKAYSSTYGIRVYYGTSTQANPGLIANNFLSISGESTYPYGMYIYNCNYLNIYHNSVALEGDSAPSGRALYQYGGSFIRLKNNIFYNNSLGNVYYISTPTAIVEADYNDLYANTTNFGFWTTSINNLAGLKNISGKESHSVSIAPAFVSVDDLHLTYSPINSAGSYVSVVTDDIDGDLRSPTTPSIGADEQPPIPIDAGVLQVLSPNATEAEAAIITPKILIKNFGTDTLFGFETTMDINGLPVDTQYYTSPLLPFEIDTITFGTFQVSPGHNNICFETSLMQDTNIFNNQLCKYFYGVPLIDMGVVSMLAPDSGQCFTNSEDLKVIIKNYGSMVINFAQKPVTINCSVIAPNTVSIPNYVLTTGSLQPGASTSITITSNLDMNHSGDYYFNIWTTVAGDGDETNDSMKSKKINAFATVVNYPYQQDFENFVASSNTLDPGQLAEGWAQNNPSTDYTWYVGKGATYTANTGPSSDHSLGTASGTYCYAEAGYNSATANLVTPCIDLSSMAHPILRYWYHMFGSNIHSLRVDVYYNGQWYYSIGHLMGQQQNSVTDAWKQDFVDLSAYAGQTIKLRFRAIKLIGYEADIAIDDISIFEPVQKDAGISNTFQKPTTNFAAAGTQTPIQIKIENYGLDTLKSLFVSYIAGANAPVLEQWTGSIPPYSYQLHEFTKKYTVAPGETRISAFTSYNGDMNQANDTGSILFTGVSVFQVPYEDNFEGTNYFVSTGGLKQWQKGKPNKNIYTAAHSGNSAWVTSLNDNYLANSNDYLYSPFFDLLSFPNTYLRIWHRMDVQEGYDGGLIEVSTDGGTTFTSLGYITDPLSTHWYNANIGGTHFWSQSDSGWMYSTYSLSSIVALQPVQFRFKFYSNNSNNQFEGWMIDDFAITPNAISQDAGVKEILSPIGYTSVGTNITVSVQLKNYGTTALTQIPVNYRINSGAPITQNWTGTLPPGATTNFTFTATYTASAVYELQTWTSLSGDTYWFNDSTKVKMSRDAGILAIIYPKPVEIYNDSALITVQFKNFGNDTLTTCNLVYDINAGNAITETWTGKLAPEEIAFYTFNKKWKVNYGINNFCAKTSLTGDTEGSNDKKCLYVSGLVGIEETPKSRFHLSQNEPNPFNKKSTILLTVPKAGKATVKLTDLSGRVIKTETITVIAGKNSLEIEGQSLNQGVYFYEVSYDGNRQTVKIMVGDF